MFHIAVSQVTLLKDGQELPEELVKKAAAAEVKSSPQSATSPPGEEEGGTVNTAALKDKVRHYS